MSEEKAKGKYFDPVKAAIYRELEKATVEMTDALSVGKIDEAKTLAKIVRDLNGQLKAGARGSSNLLTETPDAVLGMEPARGEALIIVKTCAGVECRKIAIKEAIKYKRINVSIENIWAYPAVKETEEKAPETVVSVPKTDVLKPKTAKTAK